jgi:replicative DNA helicase
MSDSVSGWHKIIEEEGLPHDIQTEKIILGSIQLNNDLIKQDHSKLKEDDFHLESHRIIFRSMLSLSSQQMAVDAITLKADLNQRGLLEEIGGLTYLASLSDGVPRTDTLVPYVRILKQHARQRNFIIELNKALTRVFNKEDIKIIIADVSKFCEQAIAADAQKYPGFYDSLHTFLGADHKVPEQIIFGVHRGEVAQLAAVTNYGKSTLLLNLSLSLAGGQMCLPLLPAPPPSPRRIVYVDCESSASRLKADLQIMLREISNAQLARDNFVPVVDAEIASLTLNLSNEAHLKLLTNFARYYKADLVVIDTMSSGFELHNENDNAEINRRVMNPLKKLARDVDCAVIFAHHIGKSNEAQSGEGAYKGRGGSTLGALSRTVFTLEKDAQHGAGYIVLKCAKTKGEAFDPILLKLNRQTRWFEVCDEKPVIKAGLTAQDIEIFVQAKGAVSTTDVCEYFKDDASERTIKERVKQAEAMKLIKKDGNKRTDKWISCLSPRVEDESEDPESAPTDENEDDEELVQECSSYRDCTSAPTEPSSQSEESEAAEEEREQFAL